jgi:hypothetical protein
VCAIENHCVAGLNFGLHSFAAKWHPMGRTGISTERAIQLSTIDENLYLTALGCAGHLREQTSPEVFGGSHATPGFIGIPASRTTAPALGGITLRPPWGSATGGVAHFNKSLVGVLFQKRPGGAVFNVPIPELGGTLIVNCRRFRPMPFRTKGAIL